MASIGRVGSLSRVVLGSEPKGETEHRRGMLLREHLELVEIGSSSEVPFELNVGSPQYN
jgi:hypothetical protein